MLGDSGAAFGAVEVEIERLLAENGLPGACRRLDKGGMGVGRAGDDDGVDTGVGKCFGRAADRGAVARRKPLGRGVVGVDDQGEPRVGCLLRPPGN